MTNGEAKALLLRASFGHLGCSRDDQPYVVPMNYAYDSQALYFFTTEGTKTDLVATNSKVCFQVEEVLNPLLWRSVMVTGRAHRVTKPKDLEQAMQLISERNPSLTPAINKTEIGPWRRPARMAVYKVIPEAVYGRRTL
jgi:nitroimidazol reductase NimA-like FMN-containing flavoprotein (pyridoxamine 5'-phosphate oxidase superfamily)